MQRHSTLFIFVLAIVVCWLPLTVQGYDFGCPRVWSGPSPDNDPVACLQEWPVRDLGMLTPPIFPLFLTILLVALFPISFCCRCMGGCGSNSPRPGADCCCEGEEWDDLAEHEALLTYPERHVSCIKALIVVVLISTAICIVLISYGINLFVSGIDFLLDSAKLDVLDWATHMLHIVDSQVRKPDGTYIYPITSDTFVPITDLLTWAGDLHASAREVYGTYLTSFRNAVFVASCVPSAASLLVAMMACCNIRSVFPRLCQCFFFFLSIVCGLLGTLLLLLGIAATCGCGEITLQQWQSPGIFQWYVVQQCESQSIFGNTTANLRALEVDNSINACREVMTVCDSNPHFNISDPAKIYICNLTEASLVAECGSFASMSAVVLNLPFKNGTDALCPSCSKFPECASKCTDQDLREKVSETVSLIWFAGNATALIDRYLPELSCDSLITRFIKPLARCSDMSLGLLLVGGGAAYATLVLMWCIIFLCLGQKLFFNRKAVQEAEQRAYDDACQQAAAAGDAATYNRLVRSKSVAALKYTSGTVDEDAVKGIMGAGAGVGLATGSFRRLSHGGNSSFIRSPMIKPQNRMDLNRQYDDEHDHDAEMVEEDYFYQEPAIKNSSFLNSSFVKHTNTGSFMGSRGGGFAGLSDSRAPSAATNQASATYDEIAVTDLDS